MESANSNNTVRVSVVIPCRNEQAFIKACIRSVLNSDYPTDALEVIVCDGMSEDQTAQVVKDMATSSSNVKLLVNEQQTTPYALNLGIKASVGEVVIILGAHATISKNYVSNCVKSLFEDPSLGCVGGVLENTYSDSVSKAVAKAMSHPFGVGSAHFRTGQKSGYVDTVAFGAYRKEVFSKIGYFDETLTRNQDDEFNYRVLKAGFKIKLDTSISAKYHVRASFSRLLKQYYQYGYWKVYVNKKHNTITSFRQVVPALFLLFVILGLPISIAIPVLMPWFLVGILLYVFVSMMSALKCSLNPIITVMVMYTFLILHFSYGLGYLKGIVVIQLGGKSPNEGNATTSR